MFTQASVSQAVSLFTFVSFHHHDYSVNAHILQNDRYDLYCNPFLLKSDGNNKLTRYLFV